MSSRECLEQVLHFSYFSAAIHTCSEQNHLADLRGKRTSFALPLFESNAAMVLPRLISKRSIIEDICAACRAMLLSQSG